MARRLPSQPPVLPGFSFVHVLGSGGFADVFLFEQNMPRRQVAVKILLSEIVNEHVRQMFQAEANLMAQLSAHPSILTVYEAGVSADGRPFLVMELCSSALGERYRRDRIPVAEVLRIAIRIGSAIETAHRAGVLHRDIKPSNILLTAYGYPVLSDFGIASTVAGDVGEESVGLSIPWSAPEVLLDETPGSIASEVWAFGATVFSLLAGRSPFELEGQTNSSSELIGRIGRAKPQPIGRPDVPASLDQLLRRCMARKPEDRPSTVLEVVRELQLIEAELGLPQTPIEVAVDEWASSTVSDPQERTRVRAVAGPSTTRADRRRRRAALGTETYSPSGMPLTAVQSASSKKRTATSSPPAANTRMLGWVLGVSVAIIVVLGAIAIAIGVRSSQASDIPRVSDISASTQTGGTIRFAWTDPGILPGDRYLVQVGTGAPSLQRRASFTVDGASGQVCLTVTVNRSGRTGQPSVEKCVDSGSD